MYGCACATVLIILCVCKNYTVWYVPGIEANFVFLAVVVVCCYVIHTETYYLRKYFGHFLLCEVKKIVLIPISMG